MKIFPCENFPLYSIPLYLADWSSPEVPPEVIVSSVETLEGHDVKSYYGAEAPSLSLSFPHQ